MRTETEVNVEAIAQKRRRMHYQNAKNSAAKFREVVAMLEGDGPKSANARKAQVEIFEQIEALAGQLSDEWLGKGSVIARFAIMRDVSIAKERALQRMADATKALATAREQLAAAERVLAEFEREPQAA